MEHLPATLFSPRKGQLNQKASNTPSFCWYDLMTSDPKAAQDFYGKVVGWTFQDTGMDYTLLMLDGVQVGGLMGVPEEAAAMGAKPAWMGYIAVSDVDAYAANLKAMSGN